VKRASVAIALLAGMLVPAGAGAQNFWTAHRTLNIAHQGGETEAPSNTMYAYERAMRLGADMLEVDIHTTADGRIVALHDATVTRTTEGTGAVYDMTLRQVRRLDAAHDFVPGLATESGRPDEEYVFRGVRTGETPPPPGYRARDFRIPTLGEIIRAYPGVSINIEIKGRSDGDFDSFSRNADALAAFLNRLGRTDGIIVASFNDAALDRFHAQAPQIQLAPSIGDVALFKLANVALPEGMVAFQTPITFEGIGVTDADFVDRAHDRDYAVHVWLSNDGESEEIYRTLLGWNVDGIMAGEPGRLEEVLCAEGIERPERPRRWPGARHCSPRNSIACDVRVLGVERTAGRRLRATLRRGDSFAGRCAGRVRLVGAGTVLARERFSFGELPPGPGPGSLALRMRLSRAGVEALEEGRRSVRTVARPWEAYPRSSRVIVD
jgi:glycerophosphoryl diester phosphodiesterase